MKCSRGFTLVELLAVSCTSLLVMAAAFPSLTASEHRRLEMNCRVNLHVLSRGMHLYCENNNDYWPPYRNLWLNGQPARDVYPAIEQTMWAAKVGDLVLPIKFRGVGMMYGEGYIEDARRFYCPAQTDPWFVYESYTVNQTTGEPETWGTYDHFSAIVRMGYLFQAWGAQYPAEGNRWDIAYRTLSTMPRDKAMAIDQCVFPWASSVHLSQGADRPSFNTLHVDGSVSIYSSTTYISTMNEAWGGVLKNWADVAGPRNDWADMYKVLQRRK